jgi:hypothetical protein
MHSQCPVVYHYRTERRRVANLQPGCKTAVSCLYYYIRCRVIEQNGSVQVLAPKPIMIVTVTGADGATQPPGSATCAAAGTQPAVHCWLPRCATAAHTATAAATSLDCPPASCTAAPSGSHGMHRHVLMGVGSWPAGRRQHEAPAAHSLPPSSCTAPASSSGSSGQLWSGSSSSSSSSDQRQH